MKLEQENRKQNKEIRKTQQTFLYLPATTSTLYITVYTGIHTAEARFGPQKACMRQNVSFPLSLSFTLFGVFFSSRFHNNKCFAAKRKMKNADKSTQSKNIKNKINEKQAMCCQCLCRAYKANTHCVLDSVMQHFLHISLKISIKQKACIFNYFWLAFHCFSRFVAFSHFNQTMFIPLFVLFSVCTIFVWLKINFAVQVQKVLFTIFVFIFISSKNVIPMIFGYYGSLCPVQMVMTNRSYFVRMQ